MTILSRALAFAFITLALSASAQAQDFPNRSVRLIVPIPPAGGTDIAARLIAGHLTKLWSQTVIVENRTGASGFVTLWNRERKKP